jgi:hypothetical protein
MKTILERMPFGTGGASSANKFDAQSRRPTLGIGDRVRIGPRTKLA